MEFLSKTLAVSNVVHQAPRILSFDEYEKKTGWGALRGMQHPFKCLKDPSSSDVLVID
jgi:hypothetical protein